ncbi:MAG: hypothetical protein QXJ53_03250 [Candidatus Bathyarchaeia archaeon]
MRKGTLLLALFIMPLLFAVVNASIESITAWTNKQVYVPGERGTLYVNFYNSRASTIEIKNITVTYKSWQAYIDGKWVGNETFNVNENVTGGSVATLKIPFTVPSDGRAQKTAVDIEIGTSLGIETKINATVINVSETSPYMEQIVTLFTIQAVLLIVCTIVISATIFLSIHKPPPAIKTGESQNA